MVGCIWFYGARARFGHTEPEAVVEGKQRHFSLDKT
ncbi:hypothetical protein AVEN_123818-1, partial [Araneus ventricosus]